MFALCQVPLASRGRGKDVLCFISGAIGDLDVSVLFHLSQNVAHEFRKARIVDPRQVSENRRSLRCHGDQGDFARDRVEVAFRSALQECDSLFRTC